MLPNDKSTFSRRIATLKKSGINTAYQAESAVRAILYLWQSSHFPLLAESPSDDVERHLKNLAIRAHATWLAQLPILEAAFWLSSTYAILIGKEKQNKYSMYFTPPALADRLIDNLVTRGASLTEHKWFDPACGGGAFLTPVAFRLVERLRKDSTSAPAILEKISKNLRGNDIDQTLTSLSRSFIEMIVYDEIVIVGKRPALSIKIADSLTPAHLLSESNDIVICNPPYRKMSKADVEPYKHEFSEIISGQPNVYGLFMRQCIKLAAPGALIGLLTPTSYLSGQYFAKLRNKILEEVSVLQIDLIKEKEGIFLGVEQEAVLSVFKKQLIAPPKTEIYALSDLNFKLLGNRKLPSDGAAWSIPRDVGDKEILALAEKSPYRIKDYGFRIRIGSYVYYRDTNKTYKKRPISLNKKPIFPLIWSSDITSTGLLIHGRTSKQDKRPTYIRMPEFEHRSIIKRPALALQRVTSADQERRLVVGLVTKDLLEEAGGVVGENHIIFLEYNDSEHLVELELFSSLLSSQIVDRLFRCISGAVNVSIYELEQLPLPSPAAIISTSLTSKSITNSNIYAAFAASSS